MLYLIYIHIHRLYTIYTKNMDLFENEKTKKERFKKSAESRTINVLKALKVLSNCANQNLYDYNEDDVSKIFTIIEKKVQETRGRFETVDEENFKL